MKPFQKYLTLFVFIALTISAKAQTVEVVGTDNCSGSYSGYYEVKLYVYDNVTSVLTPVGELKNLPSPYAYFDSSDIDLDPVGIIKDQNNRYRYAAHMKRQTGSCSGDGVTTWLDSDEVLTGDWVIYISLQ